jgi:hypothetical protein
VRAGRERYTAPMPPTALVSVADRREQVVAILSEQYGGDRLELDELERRLALAHQATTVATLDALVADLVPAPTTTTALATIGDHPARGRVIAMFGGVDKGGTWTVPRRLTVIAGFGGAELDFRTATFAPGVTELKVYCMFGGVDLIVPPDLAVESDAIALFGGFDEAHQAPPSDDPARPVLRITGVAAFGGVDVESRYPGESRREAKRRSKDAAKALRGDRPAELPSATARIKGDD